MLGSLGASWDAFRALEIAGRASGPAGRASYPAALRNRSGPAGAPAAQGEGGTDRRRKQKQKMSCLVFVKVIAPYGVTAQARKGESEQKGWLLRPTGKFPPSEKEDIEVEGERKKVLSHMVQGVI